MTLALSTSFPTSAALPPTTSRVPEPAQTGPRDAKAWKQAQDFEQMFVEQMLGHLTSGLSGPGPLGDEGDGADVWRGMLTQEYAKTVTKAGGFGIAPSVYNELMRLQEKSHARG
jgi:Rod binding domain-containing protein